MLPDPFDSLSDDAKTVLTLVKGQHVFREGDEARGIFFVVSGSVSLARTTEAGMTVVLHHAKAGNMFAEASLFSTHYHCDAVATVPSEVCRLSKTAILSGLCGNADFSVKVSRLLATQVQQYRHLMTILAVKSAHERVFLAVSSGMLRGSVVQLASEIALTQEACYRALKYLTDQGLLTKIGRGQYAVSAAAKA